MSSSLSILNLISLILPLVTEYGPVLVKDVINLIHHNPQQPGETEQQYLDRLNSQITQNLDQAEKNDQSVEDSPAE